MSPEQARGEATDKRTDIWAFGAVLYELLANRPAFAGRTTSETLARVLNDEPDWTAVPPAVPESITRLLRRCLQKDSRLRLRDIGDARIEIEEALSRPAARSWSARSIATTVCESSRSDRRTCVRSRA